MNLKTAKEVKNKQMYTESRLAELISSAMYVSRTSIHINSGLITDERVDILKNLGYEIYNSGNKMEISWEHA